MENLLKEYPAALSVAEVAKILNVTPQTVRIHIKNNEIPCIKLGKRLVRIPKERLIDCLDEGDAQGGDKHEK